MTLSVPMGFVLVGCLLLVALFAASEAALALTNRVRLRHLLRAQAQENAPGTNEEPGAAQLLSSALSTDSQTFLATVTIAANIPLLGAAVSAFALWADRTDSTTRALPWCALTAAACVALFQITPRLLASRPGVLEKLWWVRPARIIVGVLRPVVWLLLAMGRIILRPLGITSAPRPAQAVAEAKGEAEIRELVAGAQSSGALEMGGKELIESIFTFGDTRVHEAMVPRPDMLVLASHCPAAKVMDALQESGFSRLPLYEGTVDHIVGIVHAKDVLTAVSEGKSEFEPSQIMRPALFLPETLTLDEAFERMRSEKTHLAIAIDEFGGTAGMLTVEDILEELVGEIQDEHDRSEAVPLTPLDERSALCDARLHIEDLEDDWDVRLPEGEFDTVGGWMIEQLGRAPNIGDRIETPTAVLTIHALRGQRPRTILIQKKDPSVVQSAPGEE